MIEGRERTLCPTSGTSTRRFSQVTPTCFGRKPVLKVGVVRRREVVSKIELFCGVGLLEVFSRSGQGVFEGSEVGFGGVDVDMIFGFAFS